jgi:hypothetical protein
VIGLNLGNSLDHLRLQLAFKATRGAGIRRSLPCARDPRLYRSRLPGVEKGGDASGIFGVVSDLIMATGPSLSGLVRSGLWRSIFLANLQFCVLTAFVVLTS